MKTILLCSLLLLLLSSHAVCAAEITGVVKGTDGAPLAGAIVSIEGTSRGTVTNVNGEYALSDIAPGRFFLVASLVSYSPEKRAVVVERDARVVVNFTLSQIAIGLREVVVTAEKRQANLQDVSLAVTALPAQCLEDMNIRQRMDLIAIAPNTMVAESGSHLTNLISIRGMFPSTFFSTTSLFYFDGIPIFGYGQNPMQLDDVERVEVLRGPQGTLYGRNAFAGVVNVVSRRPGPKPTFNLGLAYGDYNDRTINGGASGALVGDVLFARVSGWWSKRDGWFTNTFLNTTVGGMETWGGIVRLAFLPTSTFSAELVGNLEAIDESSWPMAKDPQTALAQPFELRRNFDSFVKKKNWMGALKLNYQTCFSNIISTTTMQRIADFDWEYDADFSEYDILGFKETGPTRNFSQELRFENLRDESPLAWTAGLFYFKENGDDDYAAFLPAYAGSINQQLTPFGLTMTSLEQRTMGGASTENAAVFGQATYTIAQVLDLTVGYRYEKQAIERNTITRFTWTGTLPNPVPPIFPAQLRGLNTIDTLNDSHSWTFFSQKYAIGYHMDDRTFLYVSAASGFHGGGFNSGANTMFPWYDPENSWNYELGVKTTMVDDRLRINGDVFLIDWDKQQLLTIGNLSSPLQTIKNAGTTQIKGLEMELTAVPFDGFTVDVAFGWLDARFTDYSFTEKVGGRDTLYTYTDNELPFAPKLNTRIGLKYELPLTLSGITGRAVINLDYQYLSPYYSSHMNLFRTAARSLVNLKAGVVLTHVELYGHVKNLFDDTFIYGTYEYRGEQQAYLGAPRTIGMGMNVRW